MIKELVFAGAASLIASAINSIAGGGTFLTFPILTGGIGLTDKLANMTSTIGLWPGSASAVIAANSDIKKIPTSILISFGVISLIGGIVGAMLLRVTSETSFKLVIPWLLLFATLIFAYSKPIAKWAGHQHGHKSTKWTIIVCIIQFFVAIYGGYFGAGIGVLMLAGLSFAGLENLNQVNALKVFLATLINGVSSIIFLFSKVDWKIAGVMAISSIIGGFVGMHFARQVKQPVLRAMILSIGIILTGFYFWKNYR